MDTNRKFLTDWLVESEALLDDELDEMELQRLTINELWDLCKERRELRIKFYPDYL